MGIRGSFGLVATPLTLLTRAARLAATAGLLRLNAAGLFALVPDFDGLGFDEALRREALLGRDAAGGAVLAVADPFDTDLVDGLARAWPSPSWSGWWTGTT